MYIPPINKKPVQKPRHLHKVPKGKRVFPCIGDLKIDGVYAYGLCTSEDSRIFSRTGMEYVSMAHLRREQDFLCNVFGDDFVLIYEVHTKGWPVNLISGACRRETVLYKEAYGVAHDMIPYDDFVEGVCSMPYIERKAALKRLIEDSETTLFEFSEGFHIRDEEHAEEVAQEYIDKGGEGIIGRDPKGIWLAGKANNDMWKIKQELSYDLEVLDLLEGKGKYKGTLGKLVCKFRLFGEKDGEHCVVVCSGMTDEQRHAWWADPDSIRGKIVKVDAMTFSANGLLREPRFKEVREDKFEADF